MRDGMNIFIKSVWKNPARAIQLRYTKVHLQDINVRSPFRKKYRIRHHSLVTTIDINKYILCNISYVCLKFVFWQLWPIGCAGCTVFGRFWQTKLCDNFGQQFFSRPRYVVNSYCLMSSKLTANLQYVFIYSLCLCVFVCLRQY